jgi:hypothetical protein
MKNNVASLCTESVDLSQGYNSNIMTQPIETQIIQQELPQNLYQNREEEYSAH